CDADGNVTSVVCRAVPDSKSGGANAGMKVKGVIQWVNAADCVDVTLHEYDYLLLDGDGDFNDRLTPESHRIYPGAKAEARLKEARAYDRFQFMRMGYFSAAGDYGKDGRRDFNMIVGLKDGYAK
ncbi:MAG TPA: glutamine--tRNA ligase, partial [Candidatus Ornithoclostridium excrementipullorum]|nr:glutamine--tRNA ligase [Candidatus Ornithoclostridium excrementipullorum]